MPGAPLLDLTRFHAFHTSAFGISNDFIYIAYIRPIFPAYQPVVVLDKADQGHAFALPPLQELHHYYAQLRHCAVHRYSDTHGVSAGIAPLASQQQLPKFPTHACLHVTPPLRRMPSGQLSGYPPDLSRDNVGTPVLTSVPVLDASSVVHSHSSHADLPDRFKALPFPLTLTTRALYPRSSGRFGVAS